MSYPQPYYTQPLVRPTSGLAVASLVMGIFGLFGGWCLLGIPCFLAVLFGHMATGQTRRGERGGHGMAIAGLIMGYLFVIPAIFMTFSFGFLAVLPSP